MKTKEEASDAWEDVRKLVELRITPLQLASLTAQLVGSNLIRAPRAIAKAKFERHVKLVRESLRFLEACRTAICFQNYREQVRILSRDAARRHANLIARYAKNGFIPVDAIVNLAKADRLELKPDELATIGIKTPWRDLPKKERTGIIFKFLCRDRSGTWRTDLADGMPPEMQVIDLFGQQQDLDAMVLRGVPVEESHTILERITRAKSERRSELNRLAGTKSNKRRKPRHRDSKGRLIPDSAARDDTGQFKPRAARKAKP